MHFTKKILLVFLYFQLGVLCWVVGQQKSLRFQHYTMEDGLPQNKISCILQDSKGFMWFGTWSGLCRFDGYTFKVFKQQDITHSSISNNNIHSICEDKNGNIWIATNKGLNILHYNQDFFLTPNNDTTLNRLFAKRIAAVASSPDGSVWIGADNFIFKITVDNNNIIGNIKQIKLGDAKDLAVKHLYCDRANNLWISTDYGVMMKKNGSDGFEYLKSNWSIPNTISFNNVNRIYEDAEGLIWITTEFGVNFYNTKTNIVSNYIQTPFQNNTLVHSHVTSVAEDVYGNILIGTLGGMSIYNKKTPNIFENHTNKQLDESSLNNNFINCIYKDRSDNIWIGTELGGINKYNSAKMDFEYLENKADQQNSISYNIINSIYEDQNNIWIGTAGGGLNKYNKKNKKISRYQYNPINSPTNINNFISVIYRDSNQKLWIGSWGQGIFQVLNENTPGERFVNYRPISYANSLINDFISSFASDKYGNLWIGTLAGLDRYNSKTGKFEHEQIKFGEIKIDQIGFLLFDKKQNLWVGTISGLFRLEFDNTNNISKITRFEKKENNANGLSDNYITCLEEDSKGNIWIGTYGFGFNKYVSDENGGTFQTFNMENGLPNNIIYTISEDNSGYLWLTTDFGLARFNIKNSSFKNFYVNDGLQNNKYYWNAAFMNSYGKLYVGGMNGLNAFYPDSMHDMNLKKFQVTITDFKIYNESVKSKKKYNGKIAVNQTIALSKDISISYKTQEIGFEFSALDFEQSASIKYAYMLKGFESEWHEVSSDRRFAVYTNLEPGTYTFMVKSTNRNGYWENESTNIQLTVVPPFWNTWWFKILAGLTIVSSVFFYNRYRVYSLEKQKRKLEKQVIERTAKIEEQKEKLKAQNSEIQKQKNQLVKLNKEVVLANEFKLNFFTNISHEFRTPLTLIIGPIENLLNSETVSKVSQDSLKLVHKNAQRLLHLVNQLMDFRKMEQGKMSLHISKFIINEFVGNIVHAFDILAQQKEIEFRMHPLPSNETGWLDGAKIENILYNLLSNAFKNTPNLGKIELKITKDTAHPSNINIAVADTGVGISDDKILLIFNRFYQIETKSNKATGTGIGLALTKELVECHKGTIIVESKPGEGSTFTINIPVKKECFKPADFNEQVHELSNIGKQVNNLTNEIMTYSPANQMESRTEYLYKQGRKLVLIVEDNNDLRTFIASRLNKTYNILEAGDGKAGFELAFSESPDLLVSDIMMPIMNGLELCNKIKTTLVTSHIPVLLLTAKAEVSEQIEGLEIGADRYLPKPFDFDLLEAHIANLLETRKKLYESFLQQKDLDTRILATTSVDEEFLKNVTQLIEDNIDNPDLNVSTLADKLLISRGHFHKKLFSLSNLSPIDFIINLRLKKSLKLLQLMELNISEVSFAVGYADPKYFSRIFKKQFGQTPSEYQESIKSK